MPFWVKDSLEFTMSVTGRMMEGWSGCCTNSGGGVEESVVWSVGGGGGGDGEGSFEEITSLIQGEAGASSWESPIGVSSVRDSSTISKWMSGMSAVLVSGAAILSESAIGTGEGAGGEGGGGGEVLSCIEGSKGTAGVSDFSAISSLSCGLGDSSVVVGGGSMIGMVLIKEGGGTVEAEESSEDVGSISGCSEVGEKLVSFSSRISKFACVSRECNTIVGGSSALANRGSVT